MSLRNQNGIALFLVLWILTLLAVIVGEFCQAMRTEANIARNSKEETQAYYLAEAGVYRTIFELVRASYFPSATQYLNPPVEGEVRWRVNTDIPAIPLAQGAYEARIDNESGKVCINVAKQHLLRLMLSGFDLDQEEKSIIVDSILDWRDKDNLHRLQGAENDYYQSLPEPYSCKNGPFDTVEELLLVRGITPEIFYGGLQEMVTAYFDKNLVDSEPSAGNNTTNTQKTKNKNTNKQIAKEQTRFSYGAININAAPDALWRSLPLVTDEMIDQIRLQRKLADFRTPAELFNIVGPDIYQTINPSITLETSPYYTITSYGTVTGSRVRQGLQATVRIDQQFVTGYRIINWKDGVSASDWSEQEANGNTEQ